MGNELRLCPSCGSLPCDWTDDPFKREARLLETFKPFLNIKDQFPQSGKLIVKALDGLTPITVTVTKAQFLAAHQAIALSDVGGDCE